VSTVEVGRAAEQRAAEYLERNGYIIIGRNWRNRWCELDIIARKAGVIHFIEVKYRANVAYGYAAEYISRDKTARLIRAALAWNQAHRHFGPYQIDVVSVEGAGATENISVIGDITGLSA
jgi:putative endonuclease